MKNLKRFAAACCITLLVVTTTLCSSATAPALMGFAIAGILFCATARTLAYTGPPSSNKHRHDTATSQAWPYQPIQGNAAAIHAWKHRGKSLLCFLARQYHAAAKWPGIIWAKASVYARGYRAHDQSKRNQHHGRYNYRYREPIACH